MSVIHIVGAIAVILLGAFAWLVFTILTDYRISKLEVIERVEIEDGVELHLKGGAKWRSTYGIVWHSFPDGNRAHVELESYLSHENDRLRLLEKWSEDS